MTKRCKKLEKDGVQWKSKWENANRALLEMAEEVRLLLRLYRIGYVKLVNENI